jgi:hypothetical protein
VGTHGKYLLDVAFLTCAMTCGERESGESRPGCPVCQPLFFRLIGGAEIGGFH